MMARILALVVACMGCINFASGGAAHADDRLEVHQLEANADDWLSKQVYVTGRFASASTDRVRLVDSDIDFRLPRASRRVRRGTKRLEMGGRLSRKGGQLIFDANSVRDLPSEAKQFKSQRKRITVGHYADMYALAKWARERGQWYSDSSLARLAKQAEKKAFDWEVDEAAERNNVERMLALAERAQQLKRPEADVLQIRHRAIWVARRRLPKNDPGAVEALAGRAAQLLPDTDKVLTDEQWAETGEYLKSPIVTYANADSRQLALLHRALWVDLMVEAFELSAVAGTPPEEIATRVKRLLPERPGLWRRFRLADLDRQSEIPGALTRGKLISIRDGYLDLEIPEKAEAVVNDWLAAMRAALAAGDGEGRLQLAADYRSLMGDDATAAELYQQALSIAPDMPEAREGLRELEFDYIDGRWQRVDALTAGAMRDERKKRRGELSVGDSEKEVLRRFPSPDRVTRTVSGTSIVEQWIYDGPPAFYIYLRRDRTTAPAKVIATHRAPSGR